MASSTRRRTRFPALVLVLLLLAQTACVSFEATKNGEKAINLGAHAAKRDYPLSLGDARQFTAVTYAQALAAAMSDSNAVQEIYDSIPKASLNGLSFEEFRLYVQAIGPQGAEKIQSFEELSDSESQHYIELISLKQPTLSSMAMSSVYFRLSTHSPGSVANKKIYPCILAVQTDEKGQACLSREWIQAVIRINNYAQLYFDSLEKRNPEALSWLLMQGGRVFYNGDWQAFCKLRADGINSYYAEKVNTTALSSRKVHILPGEACFSQDYQLSARTSSIREVYIREQSGGIFIYEPIVESLQAEDSQLLIYGQPLFPQLSGSLGPYYSSKNIHPLVGPLLSIEKVDEESMSSLQQRYRVRYYGISLIVRGVADVANASWEGIIDQTELNSRIFSFGSAMRVGMESGELFLRYPFIQENSFVLKGSSGNYAVSLSIQLEKERVAKLILTGGK